MNLVNIEPPAPAAVSAPWAHVVKGSPSLLFVLNGSRLYALPDDWTDTSESGLRTFLPKSDPAPPAIRFERSPSALSLNIAQSCNLACTYCYADEGRFGGEPAIMSQALAREAISRHISESKARSVSIGFIGGEPLLNRRVLHDSVEFAVREAARCGVQVTFGITTNGTLLEPADIDLFRSHPFAVTVSLDGSRDAHDALRVTRRHLPSFDTALTAVRPLLDDPGSARIAARATLTRRNMDVSACIDALADAGFSEIGVSPLRTGPDPSLCISGNAWQELLDRMKEAGARDWKRVRSSGGSFRFSNLATALRQLYRGTAEALPCGSAASYVSLSADGHYYTCHRTVGDRAFELGDMATGLRSDLRMDFVSRRYADIQHSCGSCWARYLCGGGCHAEVLKAGRSGCDYIRGWLEYCIGLYPHVLAERADLLAAPSSGDIVS